MTLRTLIFSLWIFNLQKSTNVFRLLAHGTHTHTHTHTHTRTHTHHTHTHTHTHTGAGGRGARGAGHYGWVGELWW